MHDSFIYDVVIAGAGPVGLFLACELRLCGFSVLVLEQAEHPQSPLKRLPFGMRGLSSPTIEASIRGDAPDTLLDSYCSERHPLGVQILDWSRAQVGLMRPVGVRARSKRSSVISSTRVTARPISPGVSGAYRYATNWAVAIRWPAAVFPILN